VSSRVAEVFPGGIDPRALPDLSHRAHSAHRVAATVTAVFAVAGLAWVFLTDVALYGVISDPVLVARVETAKGWTFIALACLLLYAVAFRSAARLDRVRRLTAAVVESIADGVLLLGHDRTIAYANPAAERMLRRRRKDLIGMGAAAFSKAFRVSYPNGALVRPEHYVSQRAFDEGGPLRYKALLHPGGTEMTISVTAAGVRLHVGEPAAWVVSVMHDITASERIERLRDQFFSAAAHSLKTPVTVIKADAQLLLPSLAAEQRPIAASIERQCDRIDRLVQNLIVLARARALTLELHPSVLALEPLIERIARERIWSHRHEVRTEVEVCPAIHGDPERLALVIRNLVYEASRLSQADSALTLVARPEGDRVAVGVRYQPLPWRDRVRDTYGEYDDIGIGRCVVETIAEGHGGSLREDTGDVETTSWIYLPAGTGASP
jgi:nitrogen-specific signal transduction histidine kinase